VAAGRLQITGNTTAFTVIKFTGATGAERWRQVIPGTAAGFGRANAVAVDGNGDVVAAGAFSNPPGSSDFTVVKLAGASGTEQWRQVLPGVDNAQAVAVDGNGDVVAAGRLVIKFDGATGTEQWRQAIPGAARAVAVDGNGDVVAAGGLLTGPSSTDFLVVKLAGTSGTEQWRQVLPGGSNPLGSANAVTVDPTGSVVATGVTQTVDNLHDFMVVKSRAPREPNAGAR